MYADLTQMVKTPLDHFQSQELLTFFKVILFQAWYE
jgi:hypothetical protein